MAPHFFQTDFSPATQTVTQRQRFLRVISCCHRFIRRHTSLISHPADLLKRNAKPIRLTSEAGAAVINVRIAAAAATMWYHLIPYVNSKLVLTTGAANTMIKRIVQ